MEVLSKNIPFTKVQVDGTNVQLHAPLGFRILPALQI
jgi:hypothetical protein